MQPSLNYTFTPAEGQECHLCYDQKPGEPVGKLSCCPSESEGYVHLSCIFHNIEATGDNHCPFSHHIITDNTQGRSKAHTVEEDHADAIGAVVMSIENDIVDEETLMRLITPNALSPEEAKNVLRRIQATMVVSGINTTLYGEEVIGKIVRKYAEIRKQGEPPRTQGEIEEITARIFALYRGISEVELIDGGVAIGPASTLDEIINAYSEDRIAAGDAALMLYPKYQSENDFFNSIITFRNVLTAEKGEALEQAAFELL